MHRHSPFLSRLLSIPILLTACQGDGGDDPASTGVSATGGGHEGSSSGGSTGLPGSSSSGGGSSTGGGTTAPSTTTGANTTDATTGAAADYWDDGTCLGPDTPASTDCKDVDVVGECDEASRVIWCIEGTLYCIDCASQNLVCGWDDVNMFNNCQIPTGGTEG